VTCGTNVTIPESVFCPSGSATFRNVTIGHYSTGLTVTTRSSQVECPRGSFCVSGHLSSCPAGSYGDVTKMRSALCGGLCQAGFYCPAGSVSATAVECGSESMFCPAGAALPTNVSVGFYSTPEGTAGRRTGQLVCPIGHSCAQGVRLPCPVGRFSNVTGATVCTGVCSAGFTCPLGSTTGAAVGRECPSGAYCPAGNASAPIACPLGRYRVAQQGATVDDCSLCPAGTFGNETGLGALEDCKACAPLEGSLAGASVCWPGIVNVTAEDPEPLLPGISDGDTLSILFTKATSAPPVADAEELSSVVRFSSPLFTGASTAQPTRLTGRWVLGNTMLVITLVDTRGVVVVDTRIGVLSVNVSGVADSSGRSSSLVATGVLVGGTWGQSSTPRFLVNGRGFEASNTGRQVGIGAGDSLILRFNQPVGSDVVPVATKADIDRVFVFSTPIGTNYTGLWETVSLGAGVSDHQVRITIVASWPVNSSTEAGYRNATRVGGPLSVAILASAGLKALDQSGDPSNDTTTLTAGSWGDAVCGLSVTSRSWKQLRVSWTRPRTLPMFVPALSAASFAPGYAIEVSNTSTFSQVLRRHELASSIDATVGTSTFAPLFLDIDNLSLGVQYFVRVAVGQSSGLAWGPLKGFASNRSDCDCAPNVSLCTSELSTMLAGTAPVRPVITSVTTPSTFFTTRGDDTFDLSGTGLGLVAGDLRVNYSNHHTQVSRRSYLGVACTVEAPNTNVRCRSAPGVGRDYRFMLTVDGGDSVSWSPQIAAISYAAPVIESFAGDAGVRALTSGGQEVVITGSGFGRGVDNAIEGVRYSAVGFPSATFPAVNCSVHSDHRSVRCRTSAGVGGRVDWLVTVANQTSRTPSTSFDVPSIARVTPAWGSGASSLLSLLDTRGGQPLVITGLNFGPASPLQFVSSATMGPYALVGCNVSVAHTALRCLTPEGVGAGHRIVVTIADLMSELSVDVLSYEPPAITALLPAVVRTAGGQVVTITGTNFGATTTTMVVLLNGARAARFLVTGAGHTTAEVTSEEVSGVDQVAVTVVVGGVSSLPFPLLVGAPSIASVTLMDLLAMGSAAQEAEPCFVAAGRNPNADIVVVTGDNFGNTSSVVSVTFVPEGSSTPVPCVLCGPVQHARLQCPVPSSITRAMTASLIVTVAPGRSVNSTYKYVGRATMPMFLTNGRGFEAVGSGPQPGLGAGDSLVLRFNQAVFSASVPVATKANIDALLWFSQPIGTSYTGVWRTVDGSSELVITVVAATANATTAAYRNATRVGGPLRVSVLASANLRVLDQSGVSSNDTTTLTSGSWGDAVCDLSVTSRSWRKLRVAWSRPRTSVGFSPGYAVEVSTSSVFSTVLQRHELPSSVFLPAFVDLDGLSLNVSYFVRVAVGLPSELGWGPFKGFSASRGDCDCTPDVAACPVEEHTMLSAAATQRPALASVTTPSTSFSTRGDDTFDLFGTGLGLVAGDLLVNYSNHHTQVTARSYLGVACTVEAPNTNVRCRSAPGVGRDYRFMLTVDGGDSVSWSPEEQYISYAAPVIESFSGQGMAGALTSGGQEVVITGSGFGPVEDTGSIDFVRYFAVGVSNASFLASSCNVTVSHRTMVCRTREGVGGRVTWSVSVANQTSTTPSTSFAVPVIYNVSAAWGDGSVDLLSLLDSSGDQPVVITGLNFGPVSPTQFVSSVSMGPYLLHGCNVTVAHLELRCRTPVGVGAGHRVVVSIADLASEQSEDVLSYAPPAIAHLQPAAVSTRPGTVVTITGTNFGASTATMVVMLNGARALRFQVTGVGHTTAEVTSEDFTGRAEVEVQVVVGDLPSPPMLLGVQPPSIVALSLYDMLGALDTPGFASDRCFLAVGSNPYSDVLEIVGEHFGSSESLARVDVLANGTLLPCTICALQHELVRCPVPAFVGRTNMPALVVFSLAGRNATFPYRFDVVMKAPSISGMTPLVMPTTGGNRLLTLTGLDMKDRGYVYLVNEALGAVLPCRGPPQGRDTGPGGVEWAATGTRVVCEVPDGVGRDWRVDVVARQTNGTSQFLLSFEGPTLDVDAGPVASLPTTGGSITLRGTNFGSANMSFLALRVTVASLPSPALPLPCNVTTWNHTTILCDAPVGVLPLAVVTVTVLNAATSAPLVVYNPPAFAVLNGTALVTAQASDSEGGGVVSFSGANFGPPGLLRLFIRDPSGGVPDMACENVTSVAHAHGQCVVPAGSGAGLLLILHNGGRGSDASVAPTYSYRPPAIQAAEVLPATAPNNDVGAALGLHAPVGGGFRVRVTGRSFSTAPSVHIDGEVCQVVNASHRSLDCVAPMGYGLARNLTVTAGRQVSEPLGFNYSRPHVLSVVARGVNASLRANAPTDMELSGLNFMSPRAGAAPPQLTVLLGNSTCTRVTVLNQGLLTCTSGGDLPAGPVNITVIVSRDGLQQPSNMAQGVFECLPTTFGVPGSPCAPCPRNADCAGGLALPTAQRGAYDMGNGEYLLCTPPRACLGNGLLGDAQCAVGYVAEKCSLCKDRFYRLGDLCKPCPSLAWLYILSFVVLLALLVLAAYWLNKKRINLSALGIGIDFMQVGGLAWCGLVGPLQLAVGLWGVAPGAVPFRVCDFPRLGGFFFPPLT
jgi:hypothetical protein